jgi:hypothetical protein
MGIFIHKGNDMLRDTDYLKMASEYSTSIGVATMLNFADRVDIVKKVKGYGEYATINEIVANSVDEGIYKEVIRKVYELQSKRRGNIKDSTIYKRAYKLCK